MTTGIHRTSAGLKCLSGFLFSLWLTAVTVPAAGADPAATVPRELSLRLERLPYTLSSSSWNFATTNTALFKEPELLGPGVMRGRLWPDRETNSAIALIWDQTNRTLRLDLNLNLDLTDDPQGIFYGTTRGASQVFTNVMLPLKAPRGIEPAPVDLTLNERWAQVEMRSWWQAKVEWHGKEWQAGVIHDATSRYGAVGKKYLLLRPWAARTNRVSLYEAAHGIFSLPEKLFWDGQPLRLACQFDVPGPAAACKLELTPVEVACSEVRLDGEFLDYAVLRATNGFTAVLSEPGRTVTLPADSYSVSAVFLKNGTAQAFRLGQDPLIVSATRPTNLALGGPLTNTVTFQRRGRKLELSYRLAGVDGGAYTFVSTNVPSFVIYHRGKQVAAGQFQFG